MRIRFCTIFTLLLSLSWTLAQSQVPSKVSYQGLLTTTAGQPVADGNYDLQFDLFNAAALGTLRHSETQTGVEVLRGTFNVILGSSGPLPAIFSEQLFVEITVLAGPGIGSAITFAPRTELTSAPYALAPWVPSGGNVSFPTGNVGIGTTTPIQKLDISGGGNIYLDGSSGARWGTFWKGTVEPYQVGIYSGGGSVATNRLHFFTNGIDNVRLAITEVGNIGIGTVTPTQKLDVAGTVRMTGFNLSTSPSAGHVLTSDASGNGTWQPASGGGSQWTTSGSNIFYNTGNVGIGTTNPAAKLQVAGIVDVRYAGAPATVTVVNTSAVGGDGGASLLAFVPQNLATQQEIWGVDGRLSLRTGGIPGSVNATEKLAITSTGNVGIGTASPGIQGLSSRRYLTVSHTAVPAIELQRSTAIATTTDDIGVIDFYNGSTRVAEVGSVSGGATDAGGLLFWTKQSGGSLTQRMSISPQGNVGIGATFPSEKLEVAGNIKIGAATIRSGTGSPEGVVIGNVGDLFLRTDGGPGSTMYVKESNSGGSTGWAAK